MANGYWRTNGGVITTYTHAQLQAMESAGTLTPYTRYIASDIGEEFTAPAADQLVPVNEKVRCSLPGFGGFWDFAGNDSPAIQAALDYAASFSPRRNIELPRSVLMKDSVFVALYVKVFGLDYEEHDIPKTVIKVPSDMSLSTGFLFNFNTLDGSTEDEAWADGFRPGCGIYGVYLNNWTLNVAGVRLALFAAQFQAHNIRATRHTQLIKRLSGIYTDNLQIKNIIAYLSKDNSEYAIEIVGGTGSGGDAMEINQLNFPSEEGTAELAVKIVNSGGCRVSEAINGVYRFEKCVNAVIANLHCEMGSVIFDSSSGSIQNSNFVLHNSDANYPIECVTTAYTYGIYHVAVRNVEFRYGDGVHEPTSPAEINTSSKFVITTENCRRDIRTTSTYQAQGIRLDLAGVAVTKWNDNSYYLSQNGVFDGAYCHGSFDAVLGASMSGVYGTALYSDYSSDITHPQTRYYKAQLLLDGSVLVGTNQSSAEQSRATTASNQRIALSIGTGTGSTKQGILRLYYGTATNDYDYVANIPLMGILNVTDAGDSVNGVDWTVRGGGDVDTLIGGMGTYRVCPETGPVLIEHASQSVSYAASISVSFATGTKIVVGALTGALTHNSPTNVPAAETEVRYEFTQDGTGGRGITWSALHKGSWPTASGTANQKKVVTGRSDGTNLIFVSDSGWY